MTLLYIAAILSCMVGWVASLVVIADGATPKITFPLFCELCFVNFVLLVWGDYIL